MSWPTCTLSPAGPPGRHADPGRNRHRQGADRPRHPQPEPRRARHLRQAQLRGHPRACWRASCSATRRAPSPAPSRRSRPLRAGRRRHAVPRRDRRHPARLQPKLLRVLQEQEFERLGGTTTHPGRCPPGGGHQPRPGSDGRRREFRSDLYYRLNVFPILPPLRERREDIPLLVRISAEFAPRRGRRSPPDALDA